MDTGSSFLPSEINAAFLWAQIENIADIQHKRQSIWNIYFNGLKRLSGSGYFNLIEIPDYATNNAHLFSIILNNANDRKIDDNKD